MPQYLVANYLPDDFDPSVVTEAMIEEIHALNREMIAAGVRKFACGISPASNAKSLRKQPDGKVLVTDGPYTETKEHMGGFWILEAADMDEALAWARKGAISCDAAGEVRSMLFRPAPADSGDGQSGQGKSGNESSETSHTNQGEKDKSQYLVAVYHPDNFDPSVETEAMIEEIHALNREMIAAGVRKFACGLSPVSDAKTVRKQPDGKVRVIDGPYTETKEHVGGFWILEAADMDGALAWARKGAVVCRASVEVRELLFFPAPEQDLGGSN